MTKIYIALFLGQGGYIFSLGIPIMSDKIEAATNAECDVYKYTEWSPQALTKIRTKRKQGYKIVLIGYSLGCTSATEIQTTEEVDLLCCIAESSLAGPNNHAINKKNCKRSVLYAGPDFLSNAGTTSGFDLVVQRPELHLLMDFDSDITNSIIEEIKKL